MAQQTSSRKSNRLSSAKRESQMRITSGKRNSWERSNVSQRKAKNCGLMFCSCWRKEKRRKSRYTVERGGDAVWDKCLVWLASRRKGTANTVNVSACFSLPFLHFSSISRNVTPFGIPPTPPIFPTLEKLNQEVRIIDHEQPHGFVQPFLTAGDGVFSSSFCLCLEFKKASEAKKTPQCSVFLSFTKKN